MNVNVKLNHHSIDGLKSPKSPLIRKKKKIKKKKYLINVEDQES